MSNILIELWFCMKDNTHKSSSILAVWNLWDKEFQLKLSSALYSKSFSDRSALSPRTFLHILLFCWLERTTLI